MISVSRFCFAAAVTVRYKSCSIQRYRSLQKFSNTFQ